MKKLTLLPAAIITAGLCICIPSYAAKPIANIQAKTTMNMNTSSTPSTPVDDMKMMSDMMQKMQSMKMEMMGHKMMMMGVKMKMMGEMMSKSDNKETSDEGGQLMQLGESVFKTGFKLNPKPMDMDQGMMMCPMCAKMKGMSKT